MNFRNFMFLAEMNLFYKGSITQEDFDLLDKYHNESIDFIKANTPKGEKHNIEIKFKPDARVSIEERLKIMHDVYKIAFNVNEEEMIKLGSAIGSLSYPNMIITMNGDLGAGKTTMTKGIGKSLGIKRIINSPTFTIMKVYEGNLNLYHLDVYRIENENTDFELEEYFYLGGVSVIEWADNIKSLIPHDAIRLTFDILTDSSREVSIEANSEFINDLKNKLGE